MNYYTYTAAECGLAQLPPGELRLGGWDKVADPARADAFVVPCDLKHLTDDQLRRLPYRAGNETRHALFCISDQPTRALGFPGIFFRADANRGLVERDPSTIPWPWPVKDLGEWAHPPRLGFQYDVVFVGWNSTPLTQIVCDAVREQGRLTTYIELNNEFYGTWETRNETDKLTHYRDLFLRTLHDSRLSLCARSIAAGVVRYRFYEAMSMGRVPVHFNDHAALPFPNQIDWEKCSLHIPEAKAGEAGLVLRAWLDQHADAEILERGAYGRRMWEEWLDGAKWDELFGFCVAERLAGRL